MRKLTKRVISIICIMCMLFTTCGTLGLASAITAEEVKGLIDGLIASDIALTNWS